MDISALFKNVLLCLSLTPVVLGDTKYSTVFESFTYTRSDRQHRFWRQFDDCKAQGGWPVTYSSDTEYHNVTDWLNGISTAMVWIGLWRYRLTDYKWIDGSTYEVTHWGADEPKDPDRNLCVVQNDGKFVTEHCGMNVDHHMVCKIPVDGGGVLPTISPPNPAPCPQGYTAFGDERAKCFKIYDSRVTWETAVQRCAQESSALGLVGGLASVTTDYQRAQLVTAMHLNVQGYWVGLYKVTPYTSTWLWLDNSYISMYMYGYVACAMIAYQKPGYAAGSLEGSNCNTEIGFICHVIVGESSGEVGPTSPSELCPTEYPNKYEEYRGNCYSVIEGLNWDQAKITCEQQDASLAAIHSINENAFIQMYALTRDQSIWIGLYADTYPAEYKWTNGWYTSYTNWARNQPPYSSSIRKKCVSMGTEGQWFVADCGTKMAAVCEISYGGHLTTPADVKGFCPVEHEGIEWIPHGEQCYYVTNTGDRYNAVKFTWLGSMEKCLRVDRNAYLATIHNNSTNIMLVDTSSRMPQAAKKGLWIGLFRGKDGRFTWLDGSPLQYVNWASNFPDVNSTTRNCVYIVMKDGIDKYKWKDTACENLYDYACMTTKEQHPSTPTPTDDACPDDTWDHYGDECFLFASNIEETRDRAQQVCQRTAGAELVTINSKEEDNYVRTYLHDRNKHTMHREFWIGLKVKAGGGFQWDSSQEVTYQNFYQNEPPHDEYDEQCVALDTEHGMWLTKPCSKSNGFACRVHKNTMKQNELSGGTIAGIVIGTILGTVILVGVLFVGVVKLLKKRDVKLPYGFDNVLYSLDI